MFKQDALHGFLLFGSRPKTVFKTFVHDRYLNTRNTKKQASKMAKATKAFHLQPLKRRSFHGLKPC